MYLIENRCSSNELIKANKINLKEFEDNGYNELKIINSKRKTRKTTTM